ncbi:dimethylarginine dimethylaminohydrolase family protein [Salininema proteolyticum]|uniref:Dimethylarginine dimethylaminohydrolase family protein n=1 Tax=Salininema proteolyticum TaxID=1607685 RepID=A0ABV8U1D1_9ACTN
MNALNRRRALTSAVVGGAAAAGLAACAGDGPEAAEEEPARSPESGAFSVPNEFDTLWEVFVGRYDPDAPVPPLSYSFMKYLPDEATDLLAQVVGRSPREYDSPESVEATAGQLEDLVAVYESHGVKVHRPRRLDEAENEFVVTGSHQVFARDPMFVVDDLLVEGAMMMPSRRKEIFAYRETLFELTASSKGARWVAAPHPVPTAPDPEVAESPGPFLEGGDVFVLDDGVLAGHSGLASNTAGIDWLRRELGGKPVHEVRVEHKWLHLDCVLAVVRPGLAVCHREGLPDGLPDLIADWEVVDATEEEAHAMGCNSMCLAPNKVIVPDEHGRLIDELVKRDVEVVGDFRFDEVSHAGGGVRCATQPLKRG